jgi:hypothetical protein
MESCTLAGAALVSTRAGCYCVTLRLAGRQIGRDAVSYEQLSSRTAVQSFAYIFGAVLPLTERDPIRLRPGLFLRAYLQLYLDCCQLRIGLGCN